jgi:hypothetical protein
LTKNYPSNSEIMDTNNSQIDQGNNPKHYLGFEFDNEFIPEDKMEDAESPTHKKGYFDADA